MKAIKTMILSLVLLGATLHANSIVVQAGRSVVAIDPYSDRRQARYEHRLSPYRYNQPNFVYRYNQPNFVVQRYDNYRPGSYYYYYNDPRQGFNYNYYYQNHYRPPIVYRYHHRFQR